VSSESARDELRQSMYRWVILCAGILAYGTSQFSRQNFTGVQKYIAADLHLDKGAIGLLASVFFYSYALFQMPWGVASDKFGSRWVIGLGILLTAGSMLGFATGQSETSLLLWRVAAGIAAAAVYVPLTGMIARWFPATQRGMSQATLGGVGGTLGEGTAYFLLPVIAVYFASGWRQGMTMVAIAIAAMGVLCLLLLRTAPAHAQATIRKPFEWTMLQDVQLWCYALVYSGFVVGIRGTQTWIAVYATDVYISQQGMALDLAVVQGGALAFVAYSLLGRGVGCPLAGKLSDVLARRGISRSAVLIGWLLFAIATLLTLSATVSTIGTLIVLLVLLGMSVNLFSLVPAAISETYGPLRTASLSSFTNTLGQFSGATVLAVSGYVGVSLNSTPGNALSDYRGIWLTGVAGMSLMAVLAIGCYVALRFGRVRFGHASRPQVQMAADHG
jgi:MFS family permease